MKNITEILIMLFLFISIVVIPSWLWPSKKEVNYWMGGNVRESDGKQINAMYQTKTHMLYLDTDSDGSFDDVQIQLTETPL